MDCSTKGIIIQGAFSICKCSQVSPKMKEILCKALTKSTLGALCCAWLGSCLALRHSAAGSPGMPGPSADPVLSSFLLKGPLCKMELSPICQGCRQGKFLVPAGGDEPARAFVESLHARLLQTMCGQGFPRSPSMQRRQPGSTAQQRERRQNLLC